MKELKAKLKETVRWLNQADAANVKLLKSNERLRGYLLELHKRTPHKNIMKEIEELLKEC